MSSKVATQTAESEDADHMEAPGGGLTGRRRSNKMPSISVVLPAYNEAGNIELSVNHAYSALHGIFDDIEIIVVNDGSKDETGVIIDRLASERHYVVALHHDVNHGYGYTLRTGINRSSKDLIFFTDADLQFDFTEIQALLEWIQEYEIVAGYRTRRADPWHRKMNAWGWNILVRLILGLKVRDIDCAFKLFHREVFDNIPLKSVGAMINTEILAMANQEGMRIKEVPVSHFKRQQGVQTGAKPKVILKAFRELFVMRRKLKIHQHKGF